MVLTVNTAAKLHQDFMERGMGGISPRRHASVEGAVLSRRHLGWPDKSLARIRHSPMARCAYLFALAARALTWLYSCLLLAGWLNSPRAAESRPLLGPVEELQVLLLGRWPTSGSVPRLKWLARIDETTILCP